MLVKIKRFDTSLPMPSYQTKGAAGMDVYARVDTTVEAKSIGYIPLNVALEIPEGYWVLVAARGSTHKHGLMPAHGIGVGDWDFRGDNDEYVFPVYNFSDKAVVIEKGTRIGQIIIMPYQQVEVKEVQKLNSVDRGKFGSTGKK